MIVFISGQGTGKGTFCKMLMEQGNYNYIETGAIFRNLPADSEIAQMISRGELVPDSELFKLMGSKIIDGKDILLDGFPRTLGQAQWLTQTYANKFDVRILYLNIPRELMLQRIQKRINEGVGRADDADDAAVEKRLNSYFNTTMPAVEWLREQDGIKFSEVDVSSIDVNENFAAVENALK